jgi:hypothetical protein
MTATLGTFAGAALHSCTLSLACFVASFLGGFLLYKLITRICISRLQLIGQLRA